MTDAVDPARLRELGDFLRSRRNRLRPADVGLPPGARRRTPGLRREEVATLATISPTYLAFLEQGRDARPSRQVLDALAGALRLSAAERAHLHALVHLAAPPVVPPGGESLAPAVADLVDRLDPCPAYVTGRRWDVLAANRAARALWTDWLLLAPEARNMLWWMFTDPAARMVFVEWEQEASALLARFRSAAARHSGDHGFEELTARLKTASPEVRAWWPRHDIAPLGSGTKRLRHPLLGELELRHVVLLTADDVEQKLVAFLAADADQARIAELVAAG
ncbi:helix-turn-helix transcriptional regulator [Microbispora rosea]|uniref:helix-turn-helix transcriptional regulator n=1 Tax=Microbispora rosea TaxID=58117 RepID=UPI0037988A42